MLFLNEALVGLNETDDPEIVIFREGKKNLAEKGITWHHVSLIRLHYLCIILLI